MLRRMIVFQIMMEKEAELRRSINNEAHTSENEDHDGLGLEQGQGASSPSLTFQINPPPAARRGSPTDEVLHDLSSNTDTCSDVQPIRSSQTQETMKSRKTMTSTLMNGGGQRRDG